MRLLLVLVVSGCLGGSLDAGMRPAVIPKLSELPTDRDQRNAILDQSHETEAPEQRPRLTKSERRVVTGAAWLAAIIGSTFSKTENVTLGGATTFDEDALAPQHAPPSTGLGSDAGPLLPWIKLDGSGH